MCVKILIYGGAVVSTDFSRLELQVVDGCFGHYKKAKLNLNADQRDFALAA